MPGLPIEALEGVLREYNVPISTSLSQWRYIAIYLILPELPRCSPDPGLKGIYFGIDARYITVQVRKGSLLFNPARAAMSIRRSSNCEYGWGFNWDLCGFKLVLKRLHFRRLHCVPM